MKKNKKFEIIAIILIILFAISISPKTLQNDTFYTIKIGELIVKNKNIDMLEHFSWHSNLKYTYPHWLYDVIIYLIYNIGGMFGIYISTCIFAAILGIVFFIINVKINKNQILSFFMTILALYMLKPFIAARAQLVTYILFILQIYSIEKLLETGKKKYGIYLIIAVKNQEEKIEGFLRSVIFKILYGKDEYLKNIIVADLKSTDKTKEIVKKLAEEYQTIKPLSWKECKDIMDNIDDT